MPENAGEKFREGQHNVRGEAEERGAQAALETIGRHEELLTTKHAKDTKEISSFVTAATFLQHPAALVVNAKTKS